MNAIQLVEALDPFIRYNWDNGSRVFTFPYEVEDPEIRNFLKEMISTFDQNDEFRMSPSNIYSDLKTGEYDRMLLAAQRRLQTTYPHMNIELSFKYAYGWYLTSYTKEQSEEMGIKNSVYDNDYDGYSYKRRFYAKYEGTNIAVKFN